MKGALAAKAIDPDLIIVGEEVRCDDGSELIGLFLTSEIEEGKSPEETAARIHEQGGLVYAPHPYAYLSGGAARAERLIALADIVEAFNSRAFWPSWNRDARARCQHALKPTAAGSDAHFPWEIGRAFSEMPRFDDAQTFLAAAQQSMTPIGRTGFAGLHAATLTLHGVRRLMGRGHGVPLAG